MMLRGALLPVLAALCTTPALAQDAVEDARIQLEACTAAVETYSDHDYRACYAAFAEEEDERLNANWRAIMANVGRESELGRVLLDAQRAWLAFRDLACDHFETPEPAGTLDRLQAQACYAEMISQRADELDGIRARYEAEM